MLTNFQISVKTKVPASCSLDCCGNKFGRISRRSHRNHRGNRIVKARRYAKHVERRMVRQEIENQLQDELELENTQDARYLDGEEWDNYFDYIYDYDDDEYLNDDIMGWAD